MTGSSPTQIPWFLLSAGLSVAYFWGWLKLPTSCRTRLPWWRALCFPLGLFLIWLAAGSPLAMLDEQFLTAHMIQHLLLMAFAPYLILTSKPNQILLHGRPAGFAQFQCKTASNNRFVDGITRLWGHPVLCWSFSIGVLLVWHVPFIFHVALKNEFWHVIEHISFLTAGLFFWSPLFPSARAERPPTWSLVLYFFLATLPCDILSGFLVFSDRVVYSSYLTGRPHSNWSALDDQQCAAALMWTVVTIAYLLPAAALTIRLLGVKHRGSSEMAGSEPT